MPVELTYHGQDGTRTVVQTYRDKPGDYVVWSRELPPSTHRRHTAATTRDAAPFRPLL